MHDPSVVAFEIRRPWPQRSRMPKPKGPRWAWKRYERRSWWRPSAWSPFCTLAGREFYWPSLITIWHVEPGGRDSGEVCKHSRRWQDEDGKWHAQPLRSWRWHVRHWQVQVHPIGHLRRWALTRCAWCGGRSRKGDPVNCSMQWDGSRGKWWRGEPDLFHSDCSSVYSAHRTCVCDDPGLVNGDYGRCVFCGKSRAWRSGPTPEADEATRILAALPIGARQTPQVRALVKPLWKAAHERNDARRAAS